MRGTWESAPRDFLTPIRVIAERMGISERTVFYDLKSALRKLRAEDERTALLIMRAALSEPYSLPACGSVECWPEWKLPFTWDD